MFVYCLDQGTSDCTTRTLDYERNTVAGRSSQHGQTVFNLPLAIKGIYLQEPLYLPSLCISHSDSTMCVNIIYCEA
jgi:hypothetical protein